MSFDGKKIAIRSAAFGVTFALTLALIIGGFLWWSSRPKSWSTEAITAGKPHFEMESGDVITFRIQYPLTNHTKRDYIIPGSSNGALMFKRSDDGSLLKVEDATWDDKVRIPSGQTVNETFLYKVKLSDYNTSLAELTRSGKDSSGISPDLSKFLEKRMDEIAGFVFFDYLESYKVDMPRDWELKSSKY
jgi:hypothetical protein